MPELTDHSASRKRTLDTIFRCLANRDRRRLLGSLHERHPDSLTQRDLAMVLMPEFRETPQDRLSGERIDQALIRLHHVHVPKLEEAGLIEQNPPRGTVSITDHSAFQDKGILDVISNPEKTGPESLDRLFTALAHHRYRTILDVLSHQFGPIHTETLARELGAKEHDFAESNLPDDSVEEILVTLRHHDLPHLSAARVIEYDADEGLVDYVGHPELRVPWMHSVLGPDFRSSLTGESETQEIGTIRGREKVISFGQSLCDRADEELFCMFTDTDLLEAGCFTRIRDASRERGVTVYLGTPNPAVQEYVRENAPEVILWEPKTNWLNLPVAGNRVGRLLLADREAVMLGTLNSETDENGFYEEKSIIGEGDDNALVVMVTQMLGPYLEQIDAGADDIEASLPF